MCSNGIVQILIKNNMTSAMRPAAYINRHADGRRMSGRVLDMDTHNGIFSAHSLGTKADWN